MEYDEASEKACLTDSPWLIAALCIELIKVEDCGCVDQGNCDWNLY